MSPETKEKIRELTLAGVPAGRIAAVCGLSPNTIYYHQKVLGVPLCAKLTPEKEAEIFELLREGLTRKQIVARLKVHTHSVRRVAKKRGFPLKPGRIAWRHRVTPELREKLIAEIQTRENYLVNISGKYDVPIVQVSMLAHEQLGTSCFRPGRTRHGPLTSNFPVRERKRHA